MGLFFSFSKQRKPKGFQLQHRYYDERKLRLQKIENKSGEINEQKRNKIRQAWKEKRKNVKYEKNKRLLIILTAIIILWLAFKLLPAVVVEYTAGYGKSILQ
ncbi:MAG: hypothetical protein P8H05_05095 [Schleiferiaceae bacterium]|nr:hypothetical protein [Schleiferiaceae bacterium]MDG1881067.1 hypothetical protein [Schleiferiaceae bacterium]